MTLIMGWHEEDTIQPPAGIVFTSMSVRGLFIELSNEPARGGWKNITLRAMIHKS